MSIQVIRRSGLPIDVEKLSEFKEEFRTEFDTLNKKHGKDMLSLQQDVAKLEDRLNIKYTTIGNFDFPKSQKKTLELLSKYGNILLTTHAETGKLVFVIEDQDEQFAM